MSNKNYVPCPTKTMSHVQQKLCPMSSKNYVPCPKKNYVPFQQKLYPMSNKNNVQCPIKTMSHVQQIYVQCSTKTMSHVQQKLCPMTNKKLSIIIALRSVISNISIVKKTNHESWFISIASVFSLGFLSHFKW